MSGLSGMSPQASSEAGSEGNYSTSWYTAPSTVAYPEAYMTPFPSSTFEMAPFQTTTAQWPTTQEFYNMNLAATAMVDMERPRSRSSTFGPSANEIPWPENPLGINYPAPELPQVLPSNVLPSQSYQHTPPAPLPPASKPQSEFTTPSPPQRSTSDAQRYYPTLAPNSTGVAAKRLQDRDDDDLTASASKRRRRTPSNDSMDEENRVMLKLKQEERLPWKEIAARMAQQFGHHYEVAQLQMRWKRHPSKTQTWAPSDVDALKQAHEWFEKNKWEIISNKMQDFEAERKWTAELCSRKWAELSGDQSRRGSTTPPRHSTPLPHYVSLAEHMTPGYTSTGNTTPQYIPTTENLSHFPFMTL